jgi:hypothetical protein
LESLLTIRDELEAAGMKFVHRTKMGGNRLFAFANTLAAALASWEEIKPYLKQPETVANEDPTDENPPNDRVAMELPPGTPDGRL